MGKFLGGASPGLFSDGEPVDDTRPSRYYVFATRPGSVAHEKGDLVVTSEVFKDAARAASARATAMNALKKFDIYAKDERYLSLISEVITESEIEEATATIKAYMAEKKLSTFVFVFATRPNTQNRNAGEYTNSSEEYSDWKLAVAAREERMAVLKSETTFKKNKHYKHLISDISTKDDMEQNSAAIESYMTTVGLKLAEEEGK